MKSFEHYCLYTLGIKESSTSSYVHDVARFLDFFQEHNYDALTLECVEDYFLNGCMGLSKKTCSRYLSAIKAYVQYTSINTQGYDFSDQLHFEFRSKRLPKALALHEFEQLIESSQSSTAHEDEHLLIVLLFTTGLRVSECVDLTMQSLFLDEKMLRILGKGDKERIVILHETCLRVLNEYLEQQRGQRLKQKSSFVLIQPNGKRYTRQKVYQLVHECGLRCGLSSMHPHRLRHGFASTLIQQGADLRSVQTLLGHSDIKTTQIYTHIANQSLQEKYHAFHPGAQIKKEKK